MRPRSTLSPAGLVGPLLALAIGLVAAAPLAAAPFFASDDGLVHLWRLWEYARAAGIEGFPPRWASDAAYGLGTPLFTFYNPLAYALGIPPIWLGLTAAQATKLVFALSFLLSSLGAYALGVAWNRRSPLAAGLCAALLYTLIPYRLATVYQRGALAEALGLGIAPWVVLFAVRAAESAVSSRAERATSTGADAAERESGARLAPQLGGAPGRGTAARRAALLALASGALVLAHTIAALLVLPFAGALGLARLLEAPPADRRRGLVVLAAGLALGAMLGAVYWLPAFAEQATVHLDRARWTEVGGGFLGSFEWPWQLVQPTLLHDYARDVATTRPAPARFPRVPALGALVLALGGVALVRRALGRPHPPLSQGERNCSGAASSSTGALPLPLGEDGRRPGEGVPRYASLPTSLVVLAGITVPLLLASPLALPLWRRVALLASVQLGWRFLAVVLVACVPIAASLPELPIPRPRAVAVALAGLVAAVSLVHLPVTPVPWSAAKERPAELAFFERKTGEFALGALREYVPAAGDATPEQLALAPAADAPATPEVDVRLLAAVGAARRYRVAAATPATVTLDLLAHPSLAARLDGQPVRTEAAGDEGLLAVDVPPGEHDLSVEPTATPVERAAGWLSLAALLGAGALLAAPRRRLVAAAPLGAAGLAALLVFAPPIAGSPDAGQPTLALAATADPPAPVALGSTARALGVVPDTSQVASLGMLTIDLHLQALARVPPNEPLELWLTDATGRRVAESLGGPAGGLRPTSRWRPNELLDLRQELRLPPGLPAGDYRVGISLVGATADLDPITLPAAGAVDLTALSDPFTHDESIFGDELVLDGYTYDKNPADRPLRGSFWWRRVKDGAAFYDATLRLVDKQGNVLAEQTRRMGGTGELRSEADFALMPDQPVPPESYRLELAVRPVGGAPLPARTFLGPPGDSLLLAWLVAADPCGCVPPEATPLGARFGDGIALPGYALTPRAGGEWELALYWRADAKPSRDYTVFVHLMDGDRVVGQADDEPNGGNRPTSAWQPGEVVPDRYRLHSPTGQATAVQVGLYLPSTGARLPLDPPTPDQAVSLRLPNAGAR